MLVAAERIRLLELATEVAIEPGEVIRLAQEMENYVLGRSAGEQRQQDQLSFFCADGTPAN